MNCSDPHLMSLLCKLSTSKYILIVRNVINEIMIELISNYHYGMIVYVFTHLKKSKMYRVY